MPHEYADKTVLVTGGAGALGAAVAQHLLDLGATVHVTCTKASDAARMPFAARVTIHPVNLRDETAAAALYASLPGLWASIHTVGGFAMSPVERTGSEDMLKMFEQNALTTFLCCREAVKRMRANGAAGGAGNGAGGRIVNVIARPALTPVAGMLAYASSKAAAAAVTHCLAEEVRRDNILVNAVAPSVMDTPANRAAIPGADYSTWPKVAEIAAAIAFLASPRNTLTTGALLPVYGNA